MEIQSTRSPTNIQVDSLLGILLISVQASFLPRPILTIGTGNSRSVSLRSKRTTIVDSSIPSNESVLLPPTSTQPPHAQPDDVLKAAFPLHEKDISELLGCDYDSLVPYQLSLDEKVEKIGTEIIRLVSVVQKADNVLLFMPRNNSSLAAFETSKRRTRCPRGRSGERSPGSSHLRH